MKVSVVIPTRNRPSLVKRSILSCLHQSYLPIEIVVVDDSDDTLTEEIVSNIDSSLIRYIRTNELKNASATRNIGIRNCNGEWVAFNDDDDEWGIDKLKMQMALAKDRPNVGLIHCYAQYINGDGEVVAYQKKKGKGAIYKRQLIAPCIGGTQTALIKRSILNAVGGFDPDLKYWDDQELYIRVTKNTVVDYVPCPLVNIYANHGHPRMTDAISTKMLNGLQDLKIIYMKHAEAYQRYPFVDVAYCLRALRYAEEVRDINSIETWRQRLSRRRRLYLLLAAYLKIKRLIRARRAD